VLQPASVQFCSETYKESVKVSVDLKCDIHIAKDVNFIHNTNILSTVTDNNVNLLKYSHLSAVIRYQIALVKS
jgi:hypothetical protein